eukprot:1796246-Heterocapsa_arctica.AAC.1
MARSAMPLMLSVGAGRFALRDAGVSGTAGACMPRSRRLFSVTSETAGTGRGCVARSPRS